MTVEILRGGKDEVGGPLSINDLDDLEVALIREHGTLAPHGYNVQEGGKVAWRGLTAQVGKRGPRAEAVKKKQRDTWDRKREERLAEAELELGPEAAARIRGSLDGRCIKTAQARNARLAKLPAAEAAALAARLAQNRFTSALRWERLLAQKRTPGNCAQTAATK